MRNAAAPMTGGARIAPMPAAASIAPAVSGRIAGAPHQRPGHRAEHHGVGDAAARHRAEQIAGDRHRASGPAPLPDRPMAAIAQSTKKRPAPLCSSTAP